jgi:predicted O-methyltransferase YrrM
VEALNKFNAHTGDDSMLKRQGLRLLGLLLLIGCAASCQDAGDQLYQNLDNSKALELLKQFPDRYRMLNVPASDGRFLYDLVLQHGYKRGLEIGTANGYSALWLGMAFRKTGGHLITIEIEAELARSARQNFRQAGLDEIVDSRINDAFREIPQLEGNFDFVFIDALQSDYQKFFDRVYPKVLPGGAITAHNVIDSAEEMKDFLHAIQANPNLDTTIHKSSSRGISVSIKKGALPSTPSTPRTQPAL